MTAKNDEPLSIIRQLELMRDLQRLANQRWQEEQRIGQVLTDGLRETDEARQSATTHLESHFNAAREAAKNEYQQSRQQAQQRYEHHRDDAQQRYKGLRQEVETEHSRTLRSAVTEQQDASWETLAVFDAIKGRPRERLVEAMRRLRTSSAELDVLENDAATILKMRRQWREFPPLENDGSTGGDGRSNGRDSRRVAFGHHGTRETVGANDADSPTDELRTNTDPVEAAIAQVDQRNAAVRDAVLALYQQRLPRLFEGGNLAGLALVIWVALMPVAAAAIGWQQWWLWLPASVTAALAVVGGVTVWLFPRSRKQSGDQYQAVREQVAEARQAVNAAIDQAHRRSQRDSDSLVAERDRELAAVEQKLHATLEEKDRWKETEMSEAGSLYPSRLAELRRQLEQDLEAAEFRYNETLAELTDQCDRQRIENQRLYDQRRSDLRAAHDREWETLAAHWFEGYDAIRDSFSNMKSQCARLFPDWETTDEQTWPRPTATPAAICFGQVRLDLASVKHGIPEDERLRPARTTLDVPAMMTLAEHPLMVFTAEEEGRREAIELLQLMMLRFLTAMPPGKVRFTILDPIGLGESFASFMHLADYDELLVASRIWTETRQIEEQLTRLTAHMETVLQKYLRNEFATIDDYNEKAGEVAEPYQVLVVANFPANFSEAAARKLVSIGTSGPRCGVYTLLGVDRKLRMPSDVHLDDLLATAVHLDSRPNERRVRWLYPAFEHLPLSLDRPPSADRFNDVVRAAGRAAKDSMRVEVPFKIVAPENDQLWRGDSGRELVVPIGRAGAMRLQSVRLGRGTSQHLLVCGKTGSGKSTFLHALVTNAALHFSPDEVEFYLIDFKKGVEFKTYATHRLPHARVIAIESEREFGLSVLERLDGELRRRGELFRAAGVQDLPGYRSANPDDVMPRVLLVVDEFQELFVEDDKLAQDSALLLDRLVRQGRAFGIHVLLGSQTLSGAYSLARSTMGQMAVRVALQCSEADAHLILSDERNTAARYLSRPGEAIYNDQNGLLVGNQPFQVVWLPEPERIEYLREIEQFAAAQHKVTAPPIVFEGDQPADPAENRRLGEALSNPPKSAASGEQRAWLGAAVAIKEPTYATFGRHAGSNLLVVGSEEDSALGVLANVSLALAAQNPEARFVVLNGSRPDTLHAAAWQSVADALPQQVTVAGVRDTARVMAEVADEVARREANGEEGAPPLVVVVYDGGRFRDLRRRDDDFSFSVDRDKPPRPDRQWSDILRNGPAWGVHSLVWCDSYNDVSRLFDRQTLREFESRVVFQMSAGDSTNLLDTPAASRLRLHRGLYYSDDLGTTEKFRPYGPPTEDWLAAVREALLRRDTP